MCYTEEHIYDSSYCDLYDGDWWSPGMKLLTYMNSGRWVCEDGKVIKWEEMTTRHLVCSYNRFKNSGSNLIAEVRFDFCKHYLWLRKWKCDCLTTMITSKKWNLYCPECIKHTK